MPRGSCCCVRPSNSTREDLAGSANSALVELVSWALAVLVYVLWVGVLGYPLVRML